jgi:hypothetical protein
MGGICDSHCKQQTMTFVQAPLHPKEPSDDMSVELLLLAAIGLSAPFLATVAGSPDMLAIPGAVLAAAVALLKAVSEKRDWTQKGIVMVGTTVVGSTGPSAVIHYWWPDAIHRLIWQTYALLGFLSGIIGWMTLWCGILLWDKNQKRVLEKEIAKRFGTQDEIQP